jgi:hypothetical protein
MKRLSLLILVFSIAFLVFIMLPPFLNQEFGPYPLMKIADVFDLLTPLVLIPLYWLLFWLEGKNVPSLSENICFMVFSAFWVLGQGMHLAGNSIMHLLKGMEGTNIYNLGNFYDERLSHYLWHFGVVGLSGTLIYRQWRNPLVEGKATTWITVLAGILYGFTFFAMVIEGATAPVGITFTVLVVIFMVIYGRKSLAQLPVLYFFLVACLLALILFASWGIYWKGLPEFSEVGIID